jgi:hypothetical protein
MLNTTKIALAAALVVGGTSVALAGEGSPDLANSPAFSNSQSLAANPGAVDAYAQAGRRQDRIFFEQTRSSRVSPAEQRLFDRESSGIDNN